MRKKNTMMLIFNNSDNNTFQFIGTYNACMSKMYDFADSLDCGVYEQEYYDKSDIDTDISMYTIGCNKYTVRISPSRITIL